MELIQKILLGFYNLVKAIGLTNQPWFNQLFFYGYFNYKKLIEDPFFELIKKRPDLFLGGHIIDVGANIGYTSTLFSQVITPGFKVYAFEPEASNFKLLNQVIAGNAQNKIVPICAAVGANNGKIKLWYNEKNHGDHKVVTQEYSKAGIDLNQVYLVEILSIDSFVQSRNIKLQIKFIKIDVQGYELPVCFGLEQTLASNPEVVVAIEYAPKGIYELGFEPEEILRFFQNINYFIYILYRNGDLSLATNQLIKQMVKKRGYIDLVCSKKELL